MPMIVVREEEEGRQDKEEEKDQEKEEEAEIVLWNEEAIKKYNERAEELSKLGGQVEKTIEQKWEELKKIVEGAMIRKRYKRRRKKIGYKDWWDRQCTKKKREIQRIYKRWRQGKENRERYLEEKENFRSCKKGNKKKEREGGRKIKKNKKGRRNVGIHK